MILSFSGRDRLAVYLGDLGLVKMRATLRIVVCPLPVLRSCGEAAAEYNFWKIGVVFGVFIYALFAVTPGLITVELLGSLGRVKCIIL